MSQKTIEFKFRVGTMLTNVTSVVLRDPTNSFGVRRTDNNAVVVASGTALALISTGVYRYTFTEPASNLSFEYWLEYVYLGNTRRERQVLQGASTGAGVGGSILIAPSAYVTMGLETVSCGDASLEAFLSTHANVIWAMQARRPVLDLRYQYFVLDLTTLALDHVRMLIDTEIANQQNQDTGYSNSSNVSDSSFTSSRSRTSSSSQTASSSQSFTRTATRTSSSQGASSSSQTSSRIGSGSDTSTQTQTLTSRTTASNHSRTDTTPSGSGDGDFYRKSDTRIEGHRILTTAVINYRLSITGVGSFSGAAGQGAGGQSRTMVNPPSQTITTSSSYDEEHNLMTRTRQVVGNGTIARDTTVIGTGSRTNIVHRSSHATASASSSATSSSVMAENSSDIAHREAESLFHSESLGHAESASNALAHREGVGASSMVGTSSFDRNYYSQVFQSLQQIWKDTKAQIERLEQQVLMPTRVVIQRLAVRTPQSANAPRCALGNLFLTQNPFGTPFSGRDPRTGL